MSGRSRMDWSHGPIPCVECEHPTRPQRTAATGVWEGTRILKAHGLCMTCYDRQRWVQQKEARRRERALRRQAKARKPLAKELGMRLLVTDGGALHATVTVPAPARAASMTTRSLTEAGLEAWRRALAGTGMREAGVPVVRVDRAAGTLTVLGRVDRAGRSVA